MSSVNSVQDINYQPCICDSFFCGDELAERINDWTIAGRIFITLGAIAFIAGGLAHLGVLGLSLASAEFLVGSGAILTVPGLFTISKGNAIERQRLESLPNDLPGIRNAGCNCCINSFMQFARHIPTLRNFFKSHYILSSFYPFKLFIDQIERDEKNHVGITSADSQKIRQALSKMTKGLISPSETDQEDPDEILGLIRARMSDKTKGFTEVTETQYFRNKKGEVEACRPVKNKDWGTIKLPIERWSSLQQMFTRSFDQRPQGSSTVTREEYVDPSWWQRAWHNQQEVQQIAVNYPIVRETRKYKNGPNDLFISLKRFTNSGSKISSKVKVEERLTLDAKFTENNEKVNYELDSFIRHIGGFASFGHYVSYVKKGNDWYELNDTLARKISKNELKEAREESYIFHYKKAL